MTITHPTQAALRSPLARLIVRADGRSALWIELLFVGWLMWLYDALDNLAPLRRIFALHNAAALLSFEHSLHLDPELALNRLASASNVLGLALSYYYISLHFFVTFGVLAWLWWADRRGYRARRTQLILVNVIAFAVFWRYPLAPPRMFAALGFSDTVAATRAVGDFHSGSLASAADQYAAMPSLHVAWATWSSIAIWRLARRRTVRAIAIIYPLATIFVVLATGNHFLLDAVAGLLTPLVAIALQRALWWLWARRPRSAAAASATASG